MAPDALTHLALSRGTLDRAAHRRTDPELLARLLTDPTTRVVTVSSDARMEVASAHADTSAGPSASAPAAATPPGTDAVAESGPGNRNRGLALRPPTPVDLARLAFFLGEEAPADRALGGNPTAYVAVVGEAPPDDVPAAERWLSLRTAGLELGDRDAGIFTTAQALMFWHASHPFCPRCGSPTTPALAGWTRRCDNDGSEHYPRTDPAVIMAVVDADDRLLLGRSPAWPEGRFSVLAGFVEPGESFEAAVAREVAEEVGVAVTDVTYLGNQPWPFPASGMIGFRARALDTEITLDPTEMAEARWVSREDYIASLRSGELKTPSGISIAQRIIELWLGRTVTEAIHAGGGSATAVHW